MNITLSLFIIVAFFAIMMYMSQQKMKNKMLCTFVRPNKLKIEAWVPLDSKFVVWDRGRYGIDRYRIISDNIIMQWYARGINRFFPMLIPTSEFRWNNPNSVNQMTGEETWLTPEAMQAAWEERQHVAFAKGLPIAIGKKGRFPEWLFPLIIAGLILVVIFVMQQSLAGLDLRLFNLEQQIKLLMP